MSTKYKMVYRTVVTGLSHHNYALHVKQIEVGDELTICAEASGPVAVAEVA